MKNLTERPTEKWLKPKTFTEKIRTHLTMPFVEELTNNSKYKILTKHPKLLS
jgi:hypothetical protein